MSSAYAEGGGKKKGRGIRRAEPGTPGVVEKWMGTKRGRTSRAEAKVDDGNTTKRAEGREEKHTNVD